MIQNIKENLTIFMSLQRLSQEHSISSTDGVLPRTNEELFPLSFGVPMLSVPAPRGLSAASHGLN